MTDPQPLRHPLIATDRRCDTIRPRHYTMIGALIRRRRMALRLSQGALADLLDVDRSLISRYEDGSRCPDISKVPSLAAALDLPDWHIALVLCNIEVGIVRDALRAELVPIVRAELRAAVVAAMGYGEVAA